MSVSELKEQILALITTLKLTEKEILSLENQAAKWKNRLELAASKGMEDLVEEAGREVDRINAKLASLLEEKHSLKESIDAMVRQIPLVAARERSVDPDLLEQELLMLLGQTEDDKTERMFRELEKESAADQALDALKAKMNKTTGDSF